MIEKFNFYDLYAYFLPGVILLALMLAPFALTFQFSLSFQSGVFALVLSYILGYLVQYIARLLFPSKIWKGGKERFPSQILLDGDDKRLSDDLRTTLTKLINQQFGLKIIAGEGGGDANIDRSRDDAFHLCRNYVLQESKKSYAEQFQGMYALFRGASTACLLGFPGYLSVMVRAVLGWGIWQGLVSGAIWLCITLWILKRFHLQEEPAPKTETGLLKRAWLSFYAQWYFWLLSAIAVVLGGFFDILALSRNHHLSYSGILSSSVATVLLLAATALVFAASSRSMMWEFAGTVYREYSGLRQKAEPEAKGTSNGSFRCFRRLLGPRH